MRCLIRDVGGSHLAERPAATAATAVKPRSGWVPLRPATCEVVTIVNADEKPTVALALSRTIHDMMFTPQDIHRLREVARVVGPPPVATAEHIAPLLAEATVAITGWGTAPMNNGLLAASPKLRLVA